MKKYIFFTLPENIQTLVTSQYLSFKIHRAWAAKSFMSATASETD